MDIMIAPDSSSLDPNPVDAKGSLKLAFEVYEYVPGEYKIEVRRLVSRYGNPYTTRSGKYLLVPVKVPL